MKKKLLQPDKSNIRSYAKLPLNLLFRMQKKVLLEISKWKKIKINLATLSEKSVLYNNYNKIPKELDTKQSCPFSI